MPYSNHWMMKERVLCVRLSGEITPPAIHEISWQTERLVAAGEPPVHVIVDCHQLERIPAAVDLENFLTGYVRHPNLGWLVMTCPTWMMQFMNTMVNNALGFRIRCVHEIEEALTFLYRQDLTLQETSSSRT